MYTLTIDDNGADTVTLARHTRCSTRHPAHLPRAWPLPVPAHPAH